MIQPIVWQKKIVIFAQNWPCWLGCLLAVNLPVQATYVTKDMLALYPQHAHWLSPLSEFEDMREVPEMWMDYVILGSGSHDYLRLIMTKLRQHVGPFMYANNVVFTGHCQRELEQLYKAWVAHDSSLNLEAVTVCHAEFGGVTSAKHIISFKGDKRSVFIPISPLPRTLSHVLDAAMPNAVQEIPAPSPLPDPIPRSPIYFDGLMHLEGLFDITRPSANIACQSAFKATGWNC